MIEGIGRIKINVNHMITVEIDGATRPDAIEQAFKIVEEHNGYCAYKITRPYNPRSTGFRSQNARIHGHCSDIALQEEREEWQNPEAVKLLMEYLAIERGYPHIEKRGKIIPKRTRDLNSYEASTLCETINQYADDNNFWLTEYDGKRPYRTRGGRTLAEMMEIEPELNPQYREEHETIWTT